MSVLEQTFKLCPNLYRIALIFIDPFFFQSRSYLVCHSVSILRYLYSTIFADIRWVQFVLCQFWANLKPCPNLYKIAYIFMWTARQSIPVIHFTTLFLPLDFQTPPSSVTSGKYSLFYFNFPIVSFGASFWTASKHM